MDSNYFESKSQDHVFGLNGQFFKDYQHFISKRAFNPAGSVHVCTCVPSRTGLKYDTHPDTPTT